MNSKKELANRSDVQLLVTVFYQKIRKHDILGPIFNGIITDWDAHFKLLTDFWEAQLFLKRKYKGNPVTAHQEVDEKTDHTITTSHFGLWLNLWFETIDELFVGDTAWVAKNRAQKNVYYVVYENFEKRQH